MLGGDDLALGGEDVDGNAARKVREVAMDAHREAPGLDETTRELPMFPLGSVLFPGMPLPLRLFEPRYLSLLASVLAQDEPEFGVVLIERGSEVGGGDARFGVGTMARIVSVEQAEGSIGLVATGTDRFEVVRWLQEDPFPRAEVRLLPPLVIDEPGRPSLAEAEAVVRSALARASEFMELAWRADVELSPEVEERLWQVAGIAPLSPLDQYELLRARSSADLLIRLVEDTRAADLRYTAPWGDPPGPPGA